MDFVRLYGGFILGFLFFPIILLIKAIIKSTTYFIRKNTLCKNNKMEKEIRDIKGFWKNIGAKQKIY